MDAHTSQTRIEALAQRWQAVRTPEEFQEVLHELAHVFQEYHNRYAAIIADYKRLVEGLTATVHRQTATVTRLTTAVEELTAQRQTLAQAAVDAYEQGFQEYLAYTNDFLADNYDQWEQYIRAYSGLVLDPDALAAIDPRAPDTAARLCHACGTALGQGEEEQP